MSTQIKSFNNTANRANIQLLSKLEGHQDVVNAAFIIPGEDGVVSISEDKYAVFTEPFGVCYNLYIFTGPFGFGSSVTEAHIGLQFVMFLHVRALRFHSTIFVLILFF